MIERELTATEVKTLRLPTAGCCCRNHGHRWYERTEDADQWLECYFCSEAVEK